jgi:hypothetical protein
MTLYISSLFTSFLLGMCYILCMTKSSVCVASGAKGGCNGTSPPYVGGGGLLH